MALSTTFTAYDKGTMGSLTRRNVILKTEPDLCVIDMNTTTKFVFKIKAEGLDNDETITIQSYGAIEVDENFDGEFYKSMKILNGESVDNALSFKGDGLYLFEYSTPNSSFLRFNVTSSLGDDSNAVIDIKFRSFKDY